MKISSHRFASIIPILLGIFTFWLISGFNFLNPWSLDAFQYSDNFQHHLSSVFFRDSEWSFPIGLNQKYGLIESSSVVYSDSIPIMAILFKILRFLVPSHLQYLGLWTLICLILQSIVAWELLKPVTNDFILRTIGTGFFLFAPALLIRVGLHASLVAQFLILAALLLSLSEHKSLSRIYWLLLIVICAAIHFYIFFIVVVIWAANLLDSYFRKKCISLIGSFKEVAIIAIVVTLVFWQLGYFVGKPSSIAAGGFGFYQMNVISPLDPQGWSYLFKRLTPLSQTIEGFLYFGMGVFFLIPFAFWKVDSLLRTLKFRISRNLFLVISLFILLLLALTNRVMIGKIVFEIPMPELILSFGNIIRSSGRMFWPITYLFILLLLTLIIRNYSSRQAKLILATGLAIQFFDTSAGWLSVRSHINQPSNLGKEIQFNHPFWKSAASQYKNVLTIIPQKMYDESWNWIPVAIFAAENHLGTNSAYLSRIVPLENRPINNEKLSKSFINGNYDSNNLYVLSEQMALVALEHMNRNNDILAKIDGLIVFAPNYKKCSTCKDIPTEEQLNYLPTKPLLNKSYAFSRDSTFGTPLYLTNGWSYPEAWGVWSDGDKSSFTLPLPISQNIQSLEIELKPFVVANHPEQTFEVWINGQMHKKIKLSEFKTTTIELPINKSDIYMGYVTLGFKFKNQMSPKQLSYGEDVRKLGIGLISFVFKS